MSRSGIYEIVNLTNGKRYVGSAVNFEQRWRQHRKRLKSGLHHSRHLHAAWKKYGEAVFEFRVLMECAAADLLREEQAEFDRRAPEYNVCPTAGSTLGRLHSAETRRKIGAKKAGLKLPPRNDEYRAKMSAAHKGRQKSAEHMAALQAGRSRQEFTDERRSKVSAALKSSYENGMRSRERPPEYREKIASTLREQSQSPEIRERLANQAAAAWASRPDEYRIRHMEIVRAARGPITEQQRQAISERQRGKSRPPHVMEAMRAANIGRELSADHRRKISENSLKSWTPERKAKQAAAMKAYHQMRRQRLQGG